VDPPEETYPGDRAYHMPDRLSIQLHWLSRVTKGSQLVARDVPVVAVRVPRTMAGDWISQPGVA
jgi:hypothetical protein